jgi:hypothetical protein
MERDINFKFEDIYINMDEKDEKHTKKLLDESSSTSNIDPFFCSYFCNSLFNCCCFFLSE